MHHIKNDLLIALHSLKMAYDVHGQNVTAQFQETHLKDSKNMNTYRLLTRILF